MVKIIELIYCDIERRVSGRGRHSRDYIRMVPQWYDKEGNLIFEKDPLYELESNKEKIERLEAEIEEIKGADNAIINPETRN